MDEVVHINTFGLTFKFMTARVLFITMATDYGRMDLLSFFKEYVRSLYLSPDTELLNCVDDGGKKL